MSFADLRFGLPAACLLALAVAACSETVSPRSHEEIIKADLAEILDLQGVSCGKVVKFVGHDRLDYHVECETGEVYRILVNAQGQVQAEAHED